MGNSDVLSASKDIELKEAESIVVRFSGDSGDGMQLTGMQFSDTTAFLGSDLNTFPDYPSEIRAPSGTIAGVSGFQVHFGSKKIFTPGDRYDVLVVMNAAALKVDLPKLNKGGIIIVNVAGFDKKFLKLAGYADNDNPLENSTLENYIVYKIDISKLTKESLAGIGVGTKETERSKNMFVLGVLFWLFDKSMEHTISFINEKFSFKPLIADANIKALHAGWNYGETTEMFTTRFKVPSANLSPGRYRNITGNHAIAIGLIAAAENSELPLFLGSYPITPASDILHELSKYKSNGVKTFQAEDEIAAVCASIGASYSGNLAVTTTSGPGLSLKSEALGFAVMLELPLVIVDVQRGGPSTGLPTKTEQSDLFVAMFGRHGEAPMPVFVASSPADCFDIAYEACRVAIEHMTPVLLLSDGYIANGSEPWKFPLAAELEKIKVSFQTHVTENKVKPYERNSNLVRPWIKPGTVGLEHRIGGLEKQLDTGDVSYDPVNHQKMVDLRAAKVQKIADHIPLATLSEGELDADLLIIGWGSTFGAIKSSVSELNKEGYSIAHLHLRYINPFPSNLEDILKNFKKILVPEMNSGQLLQLIRAGFLVPAIGYSKVQGLPFTVAELKERILNCLKNE